MPSRDFYQQLWRQSASTGRPRSAALGAAAYMFATRGLTVAFMRTLDLGDDEWTRCGFAFVPGTDIVFSDNVPVRPDCRAY